MIIRQPAKRFELLTLRLQGGSSTVELRWQIQLQAISPPWPFYGILIHLIMFFFQQVNRFPKYGLL